MKLTDFKALTFDCYGTLIDWESGMLNALSGLVAKASARSGRPMTPDQILETHARYESAQQRFTPTMPYSRLLAVVYRRIAEEWEVDVPIEECEQYGRTVGLWPAFSDTVESLAYLKGHYRLVILSNTDWASFRLTQSVHLRTHFDAIYTAEDIGSYKPDGRNFEYMLANLGHRGIAKEQILHTAESLFHDHGPANTFGLANCWIQRRHGRDGHGATMDPGETPRTDFHFTSLAEFVEAHKKALAG